MKYNGPELPTPEQCTANARVPDVDGFPAYACWYPQMGGYVGRCVVVVGKATGDADPKGLIDSCFEAYVWHDGEFPFDEDDDCGRGPVRHIHHCMPSQFINFGRLVLKLQGGSEEDVCEESQS